ncbi:capsule biosynthesis protein [Tritonibacter scottomollicae]|uniref:Capsular polysaccharide transport system permease protein n=1 Tax=Tritonibacter scottomollicae TaxID=483013 RepID=A0A2T1AK45_TRISK|nr:capsule biosynthesis protein [Tritonibacter scottomollicae]PRZ48960.1 capsular polysaccharide transport system permease protein [Tritonibacter scottomollicae]
MTTKPKAKRFRIRRSPSSFGEAEARTSATARPVDPPRQSPASFAAATEPTGAEHQQAQPSGPSPAAPSRPAANAAQTSGDQAASAAAGAGSTDIEEIKREGLTGRQLRLARRVAQKHDLPATSDYDAVRQLRQIGIDPFKRSNMLELVVPQSKQASVPAPTSPSGADAQTLPQTVSREKAAPPTPGHLSPAERRNREIQSIQRDIARRRRRKMALLGARVGAFVMIPTFVVGFYYYNVATPMYSSHSEFLVLKADSTGASGFGGLLSGTQFATSQDSIAVQAYLQSKEAMRRLDEEAGFRAHFTQDWIDPIQRLEPGATNDDAYTIYERNVKIGYDPTEGVVRMEVSAAEPEVAAEFSSRLISYAQEKVNHLSEQKRDDQVGDAERALELAEQQRRDAQAELVRLQQQGAVLDPEGVIASLRSQINTFELQLQQKKLELAALQDNLRPNAAKVEGTAADVKRLETLIDNLNKRMTDASQGENSLASLSVKIQMAQADLATRDMMLQSALQQVEQTRMEANRQVRYLTTAVEPVPSDSPSSPRKFENTILAFLIFSGIYLMCALTASILREQVSS